MTNYYTEHEDDTIFQRILERKKKANSVKTSWPVDPEDDEEVFRRLLEKEDEKENDEIDPLVVKQQQMQEEADQMLKSIAKRKAAAAHSAVVLRLMSMDSSDLDHISSPRVLEIEYHYDRINLVANEIVLRSFIPDKNDMIIECYFEESSKIRLKEAETKCLRDAMRSME